MNILKISEYRFHFLQFGLMVIYCFGHVGKRVSYTSVGVGSVSVHVVNLRWRQRWKLFQTVHSGCVPTHNLRNAFAFWQKVCLWGRKLKMVIKLCSCRFSCQSFTGNAIIGIKWLTFPDFMACSIFQICSFIFSCNLGLGLGTIETLLHFNMQSLGWWCLLMYRKLTDSVYPGHPAILHDITKYPIIPFGSKWLH